MRRLFNLCLLALFSSVPLLADSRCNKDSGDCPEGHCIRHLNQEEGLSLGESNQFCTGIDTQPKFEILMWLKKEGAFSWADATELALPTTSEEYAQCLKRAVAGDIVFRGYLLENGDHFYLRLAHQLCTDLTNAGLSLLVYLLNESFEPELSKEACLKAQTKTQAHCIKSKIQAGCPLLNAVSLCPEGGST